MCRTHGTGRGNKMAFASKVAAVLGFGRSQLAAELMADTQPFSPVETHGSADYVPLDAFAAQVARDRKTALCAMDGHRPSAMVMRGGSMQPVRSYCGCGRVAWTPSEQT